MEDFSDIKHKILAYNPYANIEIIEKAYYYSKEKLKDKKRQSGENYFEHCCEVALTLINLKLDSATIASAFLHEVLTITDTKSQEIKKEFGDEILFLCDGVTKIAKIDVKLSDEEKRAENIRKVIIATSKDLRVILLKLADRLHNMKQLKYLPREHQLLVAKETLDIYAPIAYKLGIYSIKQELEDLCLKYLNPGVYQELKKGIVLKKEQRETAVKEAQIEIDKLLKSKSIPCRVFGRAKHFFSIYKKMMKKGILISDLGDLLGLRIITTSTDNCYKILGMLHSEYSHIPGTLTDYIANPKPNMYQSIHTSIKYKGYPIEVQIRTIEMHQIAEGGIAAHWRYKDTDRDKVFENRLTWLKQILEWKTNSKDAKEFVESLKIDLFKDEIVVFTPKGMPITLPEGSSVIDFAYAVHTDIGDHTNQAKVNGKIVPLSQIVEPGDVIEIITSQNTQPSRQWLKFVKSSLAAAKIRHHLGIQKDPDYGKNLPVKIEELLKRLIINANKEKVQFARCCRPTTEDKIVALEQKDGKIIVHNRYCTKIISAKDSKNIPADWEEESLEKNVEIDVEDRLGILSEILNLISNNKININSIESKNHKDKVTIYFKLKFKSKTQIESIVPMIKSIRNIVDIRIKD